MKRNIKKIIASMLTSAMALGGANIAFAVNLPAPDVAEGYTRYEAEDAELINGANVANFKLENQAGQSNDINTEGNVVGGFKSLSSAESLNYDFSNTTSVRFTVERQAEGRVTVILGYRSSQEVNMEQRCGNIPIKCNDGTVKELEVGVDPTADKPKKQVSVDVDMKVGTNTIYVAGPIKGSGWINIDYIDVANYTDTENRVEPEEKEADDMGINPPIKTIYTADPSAHVWKTDPDKLYVYPSHDRYPQQGCNRMDAFHIYSTKNMVDYTDEGEIFSAYDLEWGREAFDKDGKFDDGTFMWAPDAAYSEKTGKYYFYYPRPASRAFNDEWMVGVAVSDYPDHGFVDVGVPIIGIGGRGMIDPCVFTDDDGRSYIYLAGGGTWMNGCAVAELNDDMVTLKEVPKVMIVEGIPEEWDENGVYIGKDENGNLINMGGIPDYHEGTYVVKRDGVYYMMYADAYVRNEDNEYGTKGAHNRQRYVYSTVSPKGPWKIPTGDNSLSSEPDGAKGVILDPESSDTSHGSIVQFKNQWYMFYHTMDLSGNGALRSFQADKLTFTDDTIDKVIQTDGSELLIGDREIIADADVVYEAEDAEFANTNTEAAQPNTEKFEYNGNQITAVTNLMIPGAYVAFNNTDGGENGGRVNIKLKYSAKTQCYAKLIVNGRDYSFINLMGTGGKGFFKGESNITVTMKPGENNTISLTEFNSAVSLDSIELRYLDK